VRKLSIFPCGIMGKKAKWRRFRGFQADPCAPVEDPIALSACNYLRDKIRKAE
jgi:hypothetical protein